MSGTGCRTWPQRGVRACAFAAPVNRGRFGYCPAPKVAASSGRQRESSTSKDESQLLGQSLNGSLTDFGCQMLIALSHLFGLVAHVLVDDALVNAFGRKV